MGSLKRIAAYLTLLALLAFPFVIYFNAQALSDYFALRGYNPPASVSNLAAQDTMTAQAKHYFYINHPVLESNAAQFRQDCGETEKTIVLGCYHSNQAGIFVYNVPNSKLAGVQQVTAAHEMLHAAYDRLNSKDKNYISGLLEDYYKNQLKDPRIIDTINSYKQSEPNDIVDEMHSVFGTEIADLPQSLEDYYSRYFSNRQAITNFAADYQSEFTSREDQIKADDARLAQMKNDIDNKEQDLQDQLIQINNDRAKLDSERASGQIQAYNNLVGKFNSEVTVYNNSIISLRASIKVYNQLVDERNSIASELASLNQSLDTRSIPQTTQ